MATRRWTSRSHSPTIFVSYRERTILFPRTFVLTKRRKKHLRSDLRRHRLYFNVFLESSSISILSSEKRGDAECWQTRRTTRWSSRDDAVALREQTSPADIRANTCVSSAARPYAAPRCFFHFFVVFVSFGANLRRPVSFEPQPPRNSSATRSPAANVSAISFSSFRNFRLVSLLGLNG